MPYDTHPEPPKKEDLKPVSFTGHRHAWCQEPPPCTGCGKPTETFADGSTADGHELGWLPLCEACFEPHKSTSTQTAIPTTTTASAAVEPAATAPVK